MAIAAVLPYRTPTWRNVDFSTADVYTAAVGESAQSAVNVGIGMMSAGRRVLVKLRAGVTYNENIGYTPHGVTGGWMKLSTNGLIPNARMTPALAATYGLPKIVAADDFDNAIKFSANCRGYMVEGLEITCSNNQSTASLIRTGIDTITRTSEIPQRLCFMYNWIHGNGANHSRVRGLQMNGSWIDVYRNWVSYINYGGVSYSPQDQSLAQDSGLGVHLIEDNFLWGCVETWAYGGGGQYGGQFTAEQTLVSDVTFRRNHIYRPLSAKGGGSNPTDEGCGNAFEFKIGRRVLVEANIFENGWYNVQAGYSISLWSVNQFGPEYYVQTCDATVRRNWFKNYNSGMASSGSYAVGGPFPPNPKRITVYGNLWTGLGTPITYDPNGTTTNGVGQIIGPTAEDVWFHHNTQISASGPFTTLEGEAYKNLTIEDNVGGSTAGWTILFCSAGTGDAGWNVVNANGSCFNRRNVYISTAGAFAGGSPTPVSQLAITNDISTIGFVDLSFFFNDNAKYANLSKAALSVSSPYKGAAPGGVDPGADIPALINALVGVEAASSDLPP